MRTGSALRDGNSIGGAQMVSNQVLQNTIEGIREIAKIDLCVMDPNGKTLATTFENSDEYAESVSEFAESQADSQAVSGSQFFKVYDAGQLEFILVAKGESVDVNMLGRMVAFQIHNMIIAYKERFDRDNFIKNLLLDNLLMVDIYNRAKKLHIETERTRVVFVIETTRERTGTELDIVRSLFIGRNGDYVTAVDETNIIVVRDIEPHESTQEFEQISKSIAGALKGADDQREDVKIAFGNPVEDIKDVSNSYKEARMALDVGKIFYPERNIVSYAALGIGRLIYQLPVPLCRVFIKEIFGEKSPNDFDEETLTTINKFFENSLNVSETSRQLYIHRNTLVYRLDKLQKSTGLDLRIFEDSITFKIALMVVKYMNYVDAIKK